MKRRKAPMAPCDYLRSGRRLQGEDLAQLQDYFTHLRHYYGIDDNVPVFTKYENTDRQQTKGPSRAAINPANHPWRVEL